MYSHVIAEEEYPVKSLDPGSSVGSNCSQRLSLVKLSGSDGHPPATNPVTKVTSVMIYEVASTYGSSIRTFGCNELIQVCVDANVCGMQRCVSKMLLISIKYSFHPALV